MDKPRPLTEEQLAEAARQLLLKKPDTLTGPDDYDPTEEELNEVFHFPFNPDE